MKHNHILETISTKYLIFTVIFIVATTIVGFATILAYEVTDVETLATFVDAIFKTIAIGVGLIWTLNRYYTSRADVTQLRVDSDVSIVRDRELGMGKSAIALLIYRLDIVNTGTTLILPYQQYLEIDSISPTTQGLQYRPLYRWPSNGTHHGGPIEPGSWSAINDAISVPANVRAIRLYLEVQFSKDSSWTWHKTLDVSAKNVGE